MIIEYGIQPNCSETVYRFNRRYLVGMPEKFLKRAMLVPVIGYSQMLPNEKEVCLYHYQSDNPCLMKWLEKNKIPYDTQQFEADSNDVGGIWKKLKMRKCEKEQEADGGSGSFYRRKPYKKKKGGM